MSREGHASMIHESSQQIPEKPDVVVTCVGGGGLLNGIVQGMRDVGWEKVISNFFFFHVWTF